MSNPPGTPERQALDDHERRVLGLVRWLGARAQAPVQRLDTHLSTVLLAGADAWKLKKPLAPGFVDFRTADARRHDGDEELRLNRRTAAALYLGVHPVLAAGNGTVRIGAALTPQDRAPARTCDWVLHMRRFDQDALLAHLAQAGRLDDALAQGMAEQLLALHAHADVAMPDPGPPPRAPGAPGMPQTAWHWMRDNLCALQGLACADDRPRIDALAAWCAEREAALRALRLARLAEGRVREGHGDAHLANWVCLDGRPVLFDALEFEPALRWLDLWADLSFAWMDLRAHGLCAQAHRLMSHALDLGGDPAGLALLPWHAVDRALVRVKVAWLHALALGDTPAARAERHAAGQLLALAERIAAGARPGLVLCWGLSGAGKSTVARALAEGLGALWLRSDVERKRLHGLAPTQRPGAGRIDAATLYGPDATRRTYAHLEAVAARALADGWPVVVDAASLRAPERQAFAALAARAGVPAWLLECRAPLPRLRERIAARERAGLDASDATVAVLDFQLGVAEPASAVDAAGHAVVDVFDTDVDLTALRQRADAWVAARRALIGPVRPDPLTAP